MEIILVGIIAISGIIGALTYYILGGWKKMQKTQNELTDILKDLQQSQELEKQLRSELAALRSRLEQAKLNDSVKAINLNVFNEKVAESMRESAKHHWAVGVCFVRINEWMLKEETLGDEKSPILLREIVDRLCACIRQTDCLAQFAPDTFIILLAQLKQPEITAIIAQRILSALSKSFIIESNEVSITCNMGIAVYPEDGDSQEAIFNAAQQSLVKSTTEGEQNYQFYQPGINAKNQREILLLRSLNEEKIYQEFFIRYHPVTNIKSNQIHLLHAELCWSDPSVGLIEGEELNALANKQHKRAAFCEWMIKKTLEEHAELRTHLNQNILLEITLPLSLLTTPAFIYKLSQLLQVLKYPPETLIIEVDDEGFQLAFEKLEKGFNMLEYLGVKFAIDTDKNNIYSGLGYWQYLPLSYLKFDASLATDTIHKSRAQATIKAMLAFAQALSLQVIVAGVNNEEQVEILDNLGCVLLEGQYFGKTLVSKELYDKLEVGVH